MMMTGKIAAGLLQTIWRQEKARRGFDATPSELTINEGSKAFDARTIANVIDNKQTIPTGIILFFPVTGDTQHHVVRFRLRGEDGIGRGLTALKKVARNHGKANAWGDANGPAPYGGGSTVISET